MKQLAITIVLVLIFLIAPPLGLLIVLLWLLEPKPQLEHREQQPQQQPIKPKRQKPKLKRIK